VEDNAVFLTQKVFISVNFLNSFLSARNAESLLQDSAEEINSLNKQKHGVLTHTCKSGIAIFA